MNRRAVDVAFERDVARLDPHVVVELLERRLRDPLSGAPPFASRDVEFLRPQVIGVQERHLLPVG